MSTTIDVIATTTSGSISDWAKVERIRPLFAEHGFDDVTLHVIDTHAEARAKTREVLADGRRLLISAGGSGTFNAVLEGCCDSGVPLGEIRLGFLRKGSADLIGKVLDMPDEIESEWGLPYLRIEGEAAPEPILQEAARFVASVRENNDDQ
jgi:diacylglycerol kinase family enzyme